MALNLTPIDRVERDYTVNVIDKNGAFDTITSIDVAVLPYRSQPTATTTWITLPVTAGEFTVIYTAWDATPEAGDVTIPRGRYDAYVREVDGSFRKAVLLERVTA